MTVKHMLASAAFAACLVGAASANAKSTVIGDEGSGNFVGNFLESAFPGTHYIVASDGETSFDPFGAGYDTSDGLNFSQVGFVWDQAADSHWNPLGSQTWVLPAALGPCGSENEPKCEPIGHFISPSPWSPGAIGTWIILDSPGGAVSDIILTYNTVNGAELKFFSDPTLSVPEPSTWALMLTGFVGLGATLRGRRKELSAA
jgi:hypothetical protein